MSTSEPIRVAILGDHETVNRWSRLSTLKVQGLVSDADLPKLRTFAPAVVVIDHRRHWSDLIPEIRTDGISAPIIIWSPSESPGDAAQAMGAGAAGVIDPQATDEELQRAVQVVLAGGSYLPPLDRLIILDGLNATRTPESFRSPPLSARETEVMAMLAEGLSARQISSRLSLSERTVNTHVANLYRKLGVSNRVEAVMTAMRMGIVSPRE